MCHILYYFNLKQQIFARFDFHTTQTNLSFKAGYLSAFQLKRRTFCGIFHLCPCEIYIFPKKSQVLCRHMVLQPPKHPLDPPLNPLSSCRPLTSDSYWSLIRVLVTDDHWLLITLGWLLTNWWLVEHRTGWQLPGQLLLAYCSLKVRSIVTEHEVSSKGTDQLSVKAGWLTESTVYGEREIISWETRRGPGQVNLDWALVAGSQWLDSGWLWHPN